MIVDVHSQLTKAIMGYDTYAGIPAVGGLKPIYEFGDEYHLNAIIKLYNQDKKSIYPLIYNIENLSTQSSRGNITEVSLKLIIATRNKHTERKNTQRWATSYRNVLFPIAQHLDTLFTKSRMFVYDGEAVLREFPNYGNGKENETTDVWDALRLDTTLQIRNGCIGNFKY